MGLSKRQGVIGGNHGEVERVWLDNEAGLSYTSSSYEHFRY